VLLLFQQFRPLAVVAGVVFPQIKTEATEAAEVALDNLAQ
jgi:hypothetical protein